MVESETRTVDEAKSELCSEGIFAPELFVNITN